MMIHKDSFLDPERMNEAIILLRQISDREDMAMVLVGGVAMQFYGSPRMTKDVDVAATSLPAHRDPLGYVKPIIFGGEVYLDPNGVKVDIIVRSDGYQDLYESAIEHAVLPELESGGYAPLRVVSPEYLAAMKLAARRPKDLEDLKWLISHQNLLNIQMTRNLVYRHLGGQFAMESLMEIEDQAELERRREERHGGA